MQRRLSGQSAANERVMSAQAYTEHLHHPPMTQGPLQKRGEKEFLGQRMREVSQNAATQIGHSHHNYGHLHNTGSSHILP